ncbi:MAG: tRNA (adenosine(37)-N6)-threonylcarbamoyltransferase complex transferase subunit TsaD [Armatimonadetes bacterium]|nr:tRNA (adenosine(37)-N6)-threonylcarbamoyltransferase complex transferase subunit TsaD [Armatimonadota bacterium]
MTVLAIESSCDETAAAIYGDCGLLANDVASQLAAHAAFGGVVPELASRMHVEAVWYTVRAALADAGLGLDAVDAVAVTHGPGLVGSLLVGLCAAKGLCWRAGKPLVGVNHLEGHIYSNFIEDPVPEFPLVTLIVSGGHSDLMLMRGHGDYDVLGRARDDAAGEAFDKVARRMGLPYPGGPVLDKLAEQGDPKAFALPRARLAGELEFSFSGLKTALVRVVEQLGDQAEARLPDLCASFRAAVVDILVEKTLLAVERHGVRHVAVCGGVAANAGLRRSMEAACADAGLTLSIPPLRYCTDNAAMIACAGYHRLRGGGSSTLTLDVASNLPLLDAEAWRAEVATPW